MVVNINTLEKSYEEGYELDGTEHKIFDAVPKTIDKGGLKFQMRPSNIFSILCWR